MFNGAHDMDIHIIEMTIARYIIPVRLDLVALWNDHFLPPATSQKINLRDVTAISPF